MRCTGQWSERSRPQRLPSHLDDYVPHPPTHPAALAYLLVGKQLLEEPGRQRGRITTESDAVGERSVRDLLDEGAGGEEFARGFVLVLHVDLNFLRTHEPCVVRFKLRSAGVAPAVGGQFMPGILLGAHENLPFISARRTYPLVGRCGR
ncbi:conserved hypothetical protein [Thiomonas arsenitoxydans]|uniref:Uncharacterized protein n=1 Tax=Thiomonas arsenitoxydans (strain DSM 22701 / CIP 110005 / 3As) TaxID=426114 RepID=D6CNW9_THIA3|nr:hypothetical protein THI_0596 [Thiomonas arsenitoxydans]CAZ90247.1 hypothetical protein THI_3667 [Thiomonas arsenitoxydans]CQR28941.1 conserved hypothetical protein [Thiomonas arsenitoxydans]CQR28942.1 conserved hypothetical protein [Thiomonas arsenitoxydans]CQR30390.1 conserved hypothetical protein [Thiomonas arsenitoxydans]